MALLNSDISKLDTSILPLNDEMLKDMGFVVTEYPWDEIEYFTTLHSKDGFTFAIFLTRYTCETSYRCKWSHLTGIEEIHTLGQLNKVLEDLTNKLWL